MAGGTTPADDLLLLWKQEGSLQRGREPQAHREGVRQQAQGKSERQQPEAGDSQFHRDLSDLLPGGRLRPWALHEGHGAAGPGERGADKQGTRRDTLCRDLPRSEEHTSELQSQSNLVCRLLLEKKKKARNIVLYKIAHLC